MPFHPNGNGQEKRLYELLKVVLWKLSSEKPRECIHLHHLPNNTEALQHLRPPITIKSFCSFLGMVSFYQCFITVASENTGSLSDHLKKFQHELLQYTEDLLSQFDQLKTTLASRSVLQLLNPMLPFFLRTDASNFRLRAMLMYYHDEIPHPITNASWKQLDFGQKYVTIKREALTIFFCITKFDFYSRAKRLFLRQTISFLCINRNQSVHMTDW